MEGGFEFTYEARWRRIESRVKFPLVPPASAFSPGGGIVALVALEALLSSRRPTRAVASWQAGC